MFKNFKYKAKIAAEPAISNDCMDAGGRAAHGAVAEMFKAPASMLSPLTYIHVGNEVVVIIGQ